MSSRKVLVTLPDELWETVRSLRGKYGYSDSEVIRNIVASFLLQRERIEDEIVKLKEQVNALDELLTTLLKTLNEKRVLLEEEFDKMIRERLR
jgi:metal-responsive CopG/Arc/MetJ family transcriptional regulator